MAQKIKIDWDAVNKKYPTLDRNRDRGPVIQGLAVDITAAMLKNELPTGEIPVTYNELQMSEVSGRINDKFDALDNEIRMAGFAASAQGGTTGSQGVSQISSE